MNIYTIGFAQKNAEEFFTLLLRNNIECLVDIRLNNISQLAAFTKAKDLKYFLKAIADIDYIHNTEYAPTKEILDNYKKGKISWFTYEVQYNALIADRGVEELFASEIAKYSNVCLLCSEPTATRCHRRLLAEYLQRKIEGITIRHL